MRTTRYGHSQKLIQFRSDDGHAVVTYSRGFLRDRIQLTVDGRLVSETLCPNPTSRLVSYSNLLDGLEVHLQGGGYTAFVLVKADGYLSFAYARQCRVVAHKPGPNTSYHKNDPDAADTSDPSAQDADFFSVDQACGELGISTGQPITLTDVKAAYRSLCKRYHPDVVAALDLPPEATAAMLSRFLRIQKAYDFLRQTMNF